MLCWDEAKRQKTLAERGLDFADAQQIFDGFNIVQTDDRRDYGEVRFLIIGSVQSELIVVVWTPRGDVKRVISMRKANVREEARYRDALDRSG
jgi:uncharacterized DUF497 family protein